MAHFNLVATVSEARYKSTSFIDSLLHTWDQTGNINTSGKQNIFLCFLSAWTIFTLGMLDYIFS